MVEFRVLGPFEVLTGGVPLDLGGPKQRAVLALLTLRANELVPVATIVEALWPDAQPPSAHAVARTYVSRLRRALSVPGGAVLRSRRPGYVLETDPQNIDAHRFEALAAAARQEANRGHLDAASAMHGRALALWRGDVLSDLLSELDLLRPGAARLEEMRLVASEERIDAELALGRHVDVIAGLEALTREHPFRERFWAQLIIAQYRAGRQTDALTAYQTVRSSLVEHAGVEPGPELRALERNVLIQADDLRWRAPAPRPGPGGGDRPQRGPLPPAIDVASRQALVGRARELDVVMDWLGRAGAGRFGVLFVAGPPGIGKTALAARAARDAHAAGAVVVLGRADEGAGVPLQPLGEAITHWALHTPPDDRGRLSAADSSWLGRIVPALADRDGAGEGPPGPTGWDRRTDGQDSGTGRSGLSDGDADRHRLFEAIARWIGILASRSPAVVVLEDMHWADRTSQLALRHLVRHPPAAGAVLIVTHRDMGAEERRGLAQVLDAARGQPHTARIDLAGLAEEDVAELVRSETGNELDDAGRLFATRLGHETGGNPLFILEAVRHLTERGAIGPGVGRWPGGGALAVVGVPSAIAELIDQRLRRLPSDTAAVLRPASVLGEHFEVPLLSRVTGRSRIEVVDALEPALDAGLIDRTVSGFRFSHALVREAIVDRIPAGRRARLHWLAGEALSVLSATHPEPPLGEIARHLAAGVDAGEVEKAVVANVRAGQRAMAALAFEEALDHFRTATRLQESAGHIDDALAYDAWIGLGHAGSIAGDRGSQQIGFRRAAAVARRRRWPDRLAPAAVGFAAYNVIHGGDRPEDEAVAAQLTDEAVVGGSGGPTVERCLLLALRTMRAVALEKGAEAHTLAETARETAEALADPVATAAAQLARAWALLGSPRPHELCETANAALSLVDRSPYGQMVRYLLVPGLAVPPLQLGDLARYESVRTHIRAHPEIRAELATGHLVTWDSAWALSVGRFADVERRTASATHDFSIRPQVAAFQASFAALERGELDRASNWATDYASSSPTAVAPQAVLAWLRAEAGDRAGAARWVETLRRQRRLDQLGWGAPLALRYLAEVAAQLDDRDLARDLRPVLAAYSGQMLVSYTAITVDGAADRAMGLVLLTLGAHDQAIERFAAALRLEESIRADAAVARTAYWHARARLARRGPGDTGTAQALADRAVAAARRVGMTRLEAAAARLEA